MDATCDGSMRLPYERTSPSKTTGAAHECGTAVQAGANSCRPPQATQVRADRLVGSTLSYANSGRMRQPNASTAGLRLAHDSTAKARPYSVS